MFELRARKKNNTGKNQKNTAWHSPFNTTPTLWNFPGFLLKLLLRWWECFACFCMLRFLVLCLFLGSLCTSPLNPHGAKDLKKRKRVWANWFLDLVKLSKNHSTCFPYLLHDFCHTYCICFSPLGMPQGVPPAPGVPPMMPQGGGPPGAPPSYGDAPPQQRQVYDGSPPPSPHHTMPHPFHLIPAQVKHIKARF